MNITVEHLLEDTWTPFPTKSNIECKNESLQSLHNLHTTVNNHYGQCFCVPLISNKQDNKVAEHSRHS